MGEAPGAARELSSSSSAHHPCLPVPRAPFQACPPPAVSSPGPQTPSVLGARPRAVLEGDVCCSRAPGAGRGPAAARGSAGGSDVFPQQRRLRGPPRARHSCPWDAAVCSAAGGRVRAHGAHAGGRVAQTSVVSHARSDAERLLFMRGLQGVWRVHGRRVLAAFDLSPFPVVCDLGGEYGPRTSRCGRGASEPQLSPGALDGRAQKRPRTAGAEGCRAPSCHRLEPTTEVRAEGWTQPRLSGRRQDLPRLPGPRPRPRVSRRD